MGQFHVSRAVRIPSLANVMLDEESLGIDSDLLRSDVLAMMVHMVTNLQNLGKM